MKKWTFHSKFKKTLAVTLCSFVAIFVSSLTIAAEAITEKDVLVSIKNCPDIVTSGQSINITIEIKSKVGKTLLIHAPSVPQKTLCIELLRNGKSQIQVKWSGPFSPEEIKLEQGKTCTAEYDISRLTPLTLQPGTYNLIALYSPTEYGPTDKTPIASNKIVFEVKPLPEEEIEPFQVYKKVVGAGEHVDVAELGKAFLKKYPNSTFSNQVRLETAFALRSLKKHGESIYFYKQVMESERAPIWMKQEAQWQMAHTLYEKGDIKNAIETLKTLSTLAA